MFKKKAETEKKEKRATKEVKKEVETKAVEPTKAETHAAPNSAEEFLNSLRNRR